MGRKPKVRIAQKVREMTEAEAAWVAGAWSAFGMCTNRGARHEPSCLLTAYSYEVPDRLKAVTGLGYVLLGGKTRWIIDHPEEVQALYAMLHDAGCSTSRLVEIERAWTHYREWTVTEGSGVDPLPLRPADLAKELAAVEALREKMGVVGQD